MRHAIAVVGFLALVGAGVFAAVALAGGAKPFDVSTSTSTSVSTSTDTSTETSTTAAGSKVWICHRTHSKKHPYRLIHVSAHALHAHLRHGDVTPGADNSCTSATQPTVSTETTTTTTTTSEGDKSHGKHGNKGKHDGSETETDSD